MVKIGVTYSPALDEEWPEILKLIDTVEIANLSYLERISGKPWTYHLRQKDPYDRRMGSLNILKPEEVMASLEKSRSAILNRKPEIISIHLGPSALETGKDSVDNHIIAVSKILPREEVFERLVESIDYLSVFAEKNAIPLAVENLDYHRGGAYEYVCESEFINEIFSKYSKLYLLLDVAHAEISAVELSKEKTRGCLLKYLGGLPLERVGEIHINHPILQKGNPLDMHFAITKTEKEILRFLLPLSNLRVINLECESNVENQLRYLRREVRWSRK